MSSGPEELTQIRKLAVEKYSENKIHTLCVYKKSTGKDYVIWVKMYDLQENLDLQNLCHLASKKLKVTAVQSILLKAKSKNTKEKWTNGLMIIKVCIFERILLII